jgi:hypothetical protein
MVKPLLIIIVGIAWVGAGALLALFNPPFVFLWLSILIIAWPIYYNQLKKSVHESLKRRQISEDLQVNDIAQRRLKHANDELGNRDDLKIYVLDESDQEYAYWIHAVRKDFLYDKINRFRYRYVYSELRYSNPSVPKIVRWVHMLAPVGKGGVSSATDEFFTLDSSPGWIPLPDSKYMEAMTIKFNKLPKNENGIQLTEFHRNCLDSVAAQKLQALSAPWIAYQVDSEFADIGLPPGFYLVSAENLVIGMAGLSKFRSIESFDEYFFNYFESKL